MIKYIWDCDCGKRNETLLQSDTGTDPNVPEVHGDDIFKGTCSGCHLKKWVVIPPFEVKGETNSK